MISPVIKTFAKGKVRDHWGAVLALQATIGRALLIIFPNKYFVYINKLCTFAIKLINRQ